MRTQWTTFRTTLTERKTSPVLLLALAAVLVLALFATHARLANAAQQYDDGQYSEGSGPVTATGVLETAAPHEPDPTPIYALTDEATGTPYELTSGFVELEPFVDQRVTIEGVPVPGNPPPGAPVFLNVTSIVPADAGSEVGVLGTITDISGSVVFVEGDPSEQAGDKGYFTVTEETEITRQGEGGSVPAAFEDLALGQTVEAKYAGEVAQSDPPQGNAGSITILEDPGPSPDESATLSFELTVEGEPPAGATFSGLIPAEGSIVAPLSDPDGDGLYTGSVEVDRFAPGPRPVPPGTEPVSLPVQIVQDGAAVIEDFGLVRIDGDKTFSATATFGGGETTMPNDPGDGIDPGDGGNGTPGGSGDADDGGSGGTAGIKTLPATGGLPLLIGAAGALILGGLIARRIFE